MLYKLLALPLLLAASAHAEYKVTVHGTTVVPAAGSIMPVVAFGQSTGTVRHGKGLRLILAPCHHHPSHALVYVSPSMVATVRRWKPHRLLS